MLNLPVFLGSIAATVLFLPGCFLWHQFQAQRNAAVLLKQADKLESRQAWREMANASFRYLKLRPDDPEGWVRLCRAMDRAATSREQQIRAVELYFQTIALAQDNNDLRRRLSELLYELGRFAVAEYHADQLLRRSASDPGGWRVKAQSQHALARMLGRIPIDKVAGSYRKAIEFNPHDVPLAVSLADIYRRELVSRNEAERSAMADAVLNRLLDGNPELAAAWLARYEYRRRYGLGSAEEDLARALALAPHDPDVLAAAGDRALALAKSEDAKRHFEMLVAQAPRDRRGYLGLGKALVSMRRHDDALRVWRQGLESVGPSDVSLLLRLADLLITIGRLSESQETLARLDDAISKVAGELTQRQRLALHDAIDFVRAKWFVAQGDFTSAIPVLQRVRVTREANRHTKEDAQGIIEILYQLAACYSGRKQPDLAARAYEDAADLDPTDPRHLAAAGEAWETAGQLDAAQRAYEQALTSDQAPAAVWILLARTYLMQQRARPEAQRDWEAFERALSQAKALGVKSALVSLIEADYHAMQGKFDEALLGLEQASHGADAQRLWQSLILGYEKWNHPQQADEALATFEKRGFPPLQVALLRATLLVHRRQYDDALAVLEASLDKAPPERRASVQFHIAQVELRAGRVEKAQARLESLRAAHPEDVPLAELLADLYLEQGNAEKLAEVENALIASEGPDGARWRYYRGRRLLLAEPISAESLAEAARVADEIEALRPDWAEAFILRGMLDEAEGNSRGAILALENAVRLGNENIHVYQRLIRLLLANNRIAEADQYLGRLMDLSTYLPQLTQLAINISVGRGQLDRAVQTAEEAARLRPDDPLTQIWLGQTLLAAGRADEAEAVFRRTIQTAPGKVEPWLALLSMYTRAGQKDPAHAALDEFERSVELPPADRDFLFAQVHEMLGEAEPAERLYRAALDQNPDDVALLERASAFFLTRDPDLAQSALRRLLAKLPDASSARATLAIMLARHGGEANWKEAFSLLSAETEKRDLRTPQELRALARLKIEHSGLLNHREAIRLLEQLVQNERDVLPEDRLQLARLYEVERRTPAARRELLALVGSGEPNPDHLRALIEFLLRNGLTSDATSWITQLEQVAPDSFDTLALVARWLSAQSREAEIEDRVEQFAAARLATLEGAQQRAPAVRRTAEIYDSVNLLSHAERWFRDLLTLDPRGYLDLAGFLARRNRVSEAVSLCLEHIDADNTPATALRLAEVLTLGGPGADDLRRAEPRLRAALGRFEESVALRLAMGNAWHVAGQSAAAIQLYREALRLKPDDPTTMNNLAMILLEDQTQRGEAEKLLNDALAAAGQQYELLDTLGLLYIRQGKPKEAVELLEPLTTLTVVGPMPLFHLALAYHQQNAEDDARKYLNDALAEGLLDQCLPPQERRSVEYLQKALHHDVLR